MKTYEAVLDLGILGDVDADIAYDYDPADAAVGWPEGVTIERIEVHVHDAGDPARRVDILDWLRQLGGDRAIDDLEQEILDELRSEVQ